MAVKMLATDEQRLKEAGEEWQAAYAAGDQAGMDAAHAKAEGIRGSYGYSGGADGSQYIEIPEATDDYWGKAGKNGIRRNPAVTNPNDPYYYLTPMNWDMPSKAERAGYTSNADQYIGSGISSLSAIKQGTGQTKTGSFTYNNAPTYQDNYSAKIDAMLNQILNREAFSYDPETDEAYLALKEQYNREGNRAMNDTLASVASGAGGMNSYAVTAAQQANDYYNTQLMDQIPELRNLAYQMYLDDLELKVQDLGLLQGVSDSVYNRYMDALDNWRNDRDFAYGVHRDDIADDQWEDEFGLSVDQFNHDKDMDNKYYDLDLDKFDYQKDRDAVADSQWEKEFGLDEKYYNLDASKFDYQKQQDAAELAAALSGGGGGGGGGSSTSSKKKSATSGINSKSKEVAGTAVKQNSTVETDPGKDIMKYSLGLGPINDSLVAQLIGANAVYEKSDGSLAWSAGWGPTNYKDKLNQTKTYNPFVNMFLR